MMQEQSQGHQNPFFESDEDTIEYARERKPSDVNGTGLRPITLDPRKTENDTLLEKQMGLSYTVDQNPPWYMCIFLGLQHYLTMVGATLTIPYILTPLFCIRDDDPVKAVFLQTILFVSGIVTLLQTTFGTRLPIVQGGTFSFLVPTMTILASSFTPCEEEFQNSNLTSVEVEDLYKVRIREIQGAIIVASLFQVVIGATGIIGIILHWITPLAIVPTISLIGLSLFDVAAAKAASHWPVAIMTMVLLALFSQYLANVHIPVPLCVKGKGVVVKWSRFFALFPVLLGIIISWGVCGILTFKGVLEEKSAARTDLNMELIEKASWFYIPYPFQHGWPTVTVSGVFGMLAGVLASMIESVGDYYACARLAGAPPPPTHAINRGIFMEGIGCVLAGIWGTGNGTTSYSENIGAIRVTGVGSRRVVQVGAVIMVLVGCLGKLGAFFVTIPEPVIGGVFCVMFSMITAVGLSNLQSVDLNSSRNLFVLGFSIFFGLAFPKWMAGTDGIVTGRGEILDRVLTVLLSTPMFVGGALGLILDNTIPGTKEERGLDKWSAETALGVDDLNLGDDLGNQERPVTTYELPLGMNSIRRFEWMSKIPLSPTFRPYQFTRIKRLRNRIKRKISEIWSKLVARFIRKNKSRSDSSGPGEAAT